jgi:hypothetical protein
MRPYDVPATAPFVYSLTAFPHTFLNNSTMRRLLARAEGLIGRYLSPDTLNATPDALDATEVSASTRARLAQAAQAIKSNVCIACECSKACCK